MSNGEPDLVRRMRMGEPRAFEEFVERHHRLLLHYARRASMRDGDDDAFVLELLNDVALALLAPGAPVPRDLRAYVVGAFRHKILARRRAHERRERAVREAAAEGGAEGIGAAGVSEASARAGRAGDAPRAGSASPIVLRLAEWLDGGLSDEERQLLVAVGEDVPQREIAAWLRTTHGAVRKRLERLRSRLAVAAAEFARRLTADEAREMERFLRRSGVDRRTIGGAGSAEGSRARREHEQA